MARPKKEIDQEQFEKLCGLQCTKEEVADWFDCSEDTIERWCKATYDESFAVVFAKKGRLGKFLCGGCNGNWHRRMLRWQFFSARITWARVMRVLKMMMTEG